MVEETMSDESTHYEVSLTAGQAFTAFVLLLLSLAAAFAFGVIIGKGHGDDRLVVRKEAPVVNEGKTVARSSIVELGVPSGSDVRAADSTPEDSAILEDPAAKSASQPASTGLDSALPSQAAVNPAPAANEGPVYAQLLSSSEAKTAEALAAKLIDGGYKEAFVERVAGEQGMVYRVRVKFASEAAAKAAIEDLKKFDSGEVWITR